MKTESLNFDIYEDQARTVPLNTLTVNVSPASFSYIYGISSQNSGVANRLMDGDVCHLTVEDIVPTVPSAPNLVLSLTGDSQVDLTWDPVSSADGYIVLLSATIAA